MLVVHVIAWVAWIEHRSVLIVLSEFFLAVYRVEHSICNKNLSLLPVEWWSHTTSGLLALAPIAWHSGSFCRGGIPPYVWWDCRETVGAGAEVQVVVLLMDNEILVQLSIVTHHDHWARVRLCYIVRMCVMVDQMSRVLVCLLRRLRLMQLAIWGSRTQHRPATYLMLLLWGAFAKDLRRQLAFNCWADILLLRRKGGYTCWVLWVII